MIKRYPAIIGYDIKSNSSRAKVLRILKKWRLDGQKSLHECLLTRQEAQNLYKMLKDVIDPKEDKLFFTWINQNRPIYNRGTGKGLRVFKKIFYIG